MGDEIAYYDAKTKKWYGGPLSGVPTASSVQKVTGTGATAKYDLRLCEKWRGEASCLVLKDVPAADVKPPSAHPQYKQPGAVVYLAGPVSGRPGSAFPLLVCGPSAPALANRLRQRAFPGRRLRSDHVLPECGLY